MLYTNVDGRHYFYHVDGSARWWPLLTLAAPQWAVLLHRSGGVAASTSALLNALTRGTLRPPPGQRQHLGRTKICRLRRNPFDAIPFMTATPVASPGAVPIAATPATADVWMVAVSLSIHI